MKKKYRMCGIVAVTGYKKALPLLMNGLEKLEYRGYDSAGIATIFENNINQVKCEGRVNELEKNPKTLTGKNNGRLAGVLRDLYLTQEDINAYTTPPYRLEKYITSLIYLSKQKYTKPLL